MADLLQEISTIIEAGTTQAGSTHATWPIYRSHLPDSTDIGDRAVGLLHAAGFGDRGGAGTDRSDIERPGLQVLVRGLPLNQYSSGYVEAEAVARAVKNALHGFSGLSSAGGTWYLGIWNESGPGFIGWDESGRPLFSINLRVERSKS